MKIKHGIFHIACISAASWLKIFVLFKFRDHTKLNLVLIAPPRPPAAFSHQWCVKRSILL